MHSWREKIVGGALVLWAALYAFARPGTGPGSADPDRSVRKTIVPGGCRIAYRWTDTKGLVRSIELAISDADLAESEQALGFPIEDLRRHLLEAEARIRRERGLSALDIAKRAVSDAPVPAGFQVSQAPARDFEFVLKSDLPEWTAGEAEAASIISAFEQRWEATHKEVEERLRAELKKYAEAHGMRLASGGLAVDYRRLVRASSARMKPIAEAFRRSFGPSKAGLLAALHSFVQAIPYRPTPAVDGGRFCSGVDVPLRVLVDDNGDCDSKAVLFAALWLRLSNYRVILIRVPEHMLAGVAVPLLPGSSLTFQSVRYLLLEMNCEGPAPPGQISAYAADALAQGNFRYIIVN
ncbi:MAG: hypothetical protein ABFD52_07490 [Acidobacteriota bacterium]